MILLASKPFISRSGDSTQKAIQQTEGTAETTIEFSISFQIPMTHPDTCPKSPNNLHSLPRFSNSFYGEAKNLSKTNIFSPRIRENAALILIQSEMNCLYNNFPPESLTSLYTNEHHILFNYSIETAGF